MQKLVNRVDHVAWIAHLSTIEEHVSRLETLAGVRLTRFENETLAARVHANWEAGLEVVAPYHERCEANAMLHDHLETKGEGVLSVVFGVDSLDREGRRLTEAGHEVGPMMTNSPKAPWFDKLVLRERMVGPFLGAQFILGEINYADGVVHLAHVPDDR